ncbi:MAG: hypothetical protein QXG02_03080 [Candidatus Anstonellales archaeon]
MGIIKNIIISHKEINIIDNFKEIEKLSKKSLNILIIGEVENWLLDWFWKRGHSVKKITLKEFFSLKGRVDVVIFLDALTEQNYEKAIKKAKKNSTFVFLFVPTCALRLANKLLKLTKEKNMFKEDFFEKDSRILYGFWHFQTLGFERKYSFFDKDKYTLFAILFAILLFTLNPVNPSDDLLRHSVVYKYDYDYSKLFIYSQNFHFNPYLIFDYIVGELHKMLGDYSLILIQTLALLTLTYAYLIHTKGMKDEFRALLYAAMLSLLHVRIISGRPAIFEAFLFLIGINATGVAAFFLGLFMGITYYLFPIFLFPLMFANLPRLKPKSKLIESLPTIIRKEYVLAFIFSALFWLSYAGPYYCSDIYMFAFSILFNRELAIIENLSIFIFLSSPVFLCLLYLYIKNGNFVYLPFIAYFLIFNQLRFVDVIVPLLAFSLVRGKTQLLNSRVKFAESIFILAAIVALLSSSHPYNQLHELKVENAKVFCGDSRCMFNTVYKSENTSITPSMEIGLTDRNVQTAIKEVMFGKLNCTLFEKYPYDYVIEKTLKEVPDCLSLVDVEGEYRIWKVKNP